MPRIALGALTTLNLSTHLDPMTSELYDLREAISTGSYAAASPAFAIDGGLRVIFGYSTALGFSSNTPSVQNHGTSINASSFGQGIWQSGSTSGSQINLAKSRSGTIGSHASGAVINTDILGHVSSWGSDGAAFVEATRMRFSVDAAPSSGIVPGRWAVLTCNTSGSLVEGLRVDSSGHTSPGTDNASSCGVAARRWSVVYAASGTINTSDAREKTEVAPLSAAELAAAQQLGREIGTFRFLAAVAAKGDAARLHAGMTVQRAIEIMAAHGLDPLRYGFICHDTWPEEVVPAVTREAPTGLLNQDGSPNMHTVVLQPERVVPAGDRYSFRIDELLLFVARGLEARIAALEAR